MELRIICKTRQTQHCKQTNKNETEITKPKKNDWKTKKFFRKTIEKHKHCRISFQLGNFFYLPSGH